MSVSVLIPAHNQEHIISRVIESVLRQTERPKEIIVICDNCSDSTESISNSYDGVRVFKTKNNKSKKAGALNQALETFSLSEYILILDGDTILDERALEEGVEAISKDSRLAAVCSKACVVKPDYLSFKQKIIWGIQHIEYGGFDSHRVETKGKIKVAHGMATLFRQEALKSVPVIRGNLIPNMDERINKIFLEDNLVEDYELTLCLKQMWKVSSCMKMVAYTDVPLSIGELNVQRTRWLRGGIDSLRMHPVNRITFVEWLSSFLFLIMITLRTIVGLGTISFLVDNGTFIPPAIILYILGFIYIDSFYRMKYVKDKTLLDWMIKVLLIPEILYGWFQAYLLLKGYMLNIFNVKQGW